MALLSILILILAVVVAVRFCPRKGGVGLHDFDLRRTMPLRGFLAVGIVVHHVSQKVPDVPVLSEFLPLGSVIVGVFLFLSGYGLMISYIKKGDDYLHGFLQRRYVRLLLPFLIAVVAFHLWQWLDGSPIGIANPALYVISAEPLPDSWFISIILLYYFVFWAVARCLRNPKAIVLALWLFTAVYVVALYKAGWPNYWYRTVAAINVGFTYALVEERIKSSFRAVPSRLLWVTIGTAAAILLVVAMKYAGIGAFNLCNYMVPLFFVWVVYAVGMMPTRVFYYLGTISYEIYVAQCIFRHKLFFTAAEYHWSVFLTLTLLASIATAALLHRCHPRH